jgi:Holliday junction resolvasome RuvABC endonuclease subunit
MGLDLSCTATGIVVLSPDPAYNNEPWVYMSTVGSKLHRDSPVRDKVERLLTIARAVVAAYEQHRNAGREVRVGIEGYAWAARGAQNDLAELHGVVKTQLWLKHQAEPVIVQASAARRAVLGTGRIDKKDIVRLVQARGVATADHNVADAWVIAEYLRQQG